MHRTFNLGADGRLVTVSDAVGARAQRADGVRPPERHVLGGQFAAPQDVEDEVGDVGLELGRDLHQTLDGGARRDHVVDAGLAGQPRHDDPRSL